MLRITIFAVGKLKEQFWKDAVAEYLKRLGGYAKIEVRELPDSNAEKEASALLSTLPERGPIILMDIRGKETSSEGLAQKIDNYALNSDSHKRSEAARHRAHQLWAHNPTPQPCSRCSA